MEAFIDDIAKEASVYFSLGTVVKDVVKNDTYEIIEINKGGLLFEHKPLFRGEQKNNLHIGYDELVRAFALNRFFISGFSTVVEGGDKHDVEKLKRAVKDTRHKIELEEQSDLARRLEAERIKLSLKRKTKRTVRQVRVDEEFKTQEELEKIKKEKEELEARIAQEEADRLAKIAHDKKIKILNIKKRSQQQRFRFFNKTNNF